MFLNNWKEILLQIKDNEGHTEQGVCMLLLLVIDVIELGISSFKQRHELKGAIPARKTDRKPPKKRRPSATPNSSSNHTAIPSDVASFVRNFYRRIPVYVLTEERLTNLLLREKLLRSKNRQVHFLGFDCEWVNGESSDGINSPVALIQLATQSECFLIRLSSLTNAVPKVLKDILEERSITKLGVGVQEDCKRLQSLGINVCGTVDLRFLIERCYCKKSIIKFPERINGISLSSLFSGIIGLEMDKSYKVRCSNWEARDLTKRQIAYAANDAIAALQIFLALCIQKVQAKGIVPLNECLIRRKEKHSGNQLLLMSFLSGRAYCFSQANFSIQVLDIWNNFPDMKIIDDEVMKRGSSLCQGVTDLAFKSKQNFLGNKQSPKSSSNSSLQKLSNKTISVRKSPLYHNCLLLAPDGVVLCTCDRKKAEWYITKELGTLVKEDPYTVQLNFDPSGRPFVDRDYYTTEKDNICVVCAKEDDYVKKMVVPRDYRRHFPPNFKDHLSHDVLLLCVSCHRLSELHDIKLKRKIADDYGIPLGNSKSIDDPVLKRVRSAAKALMHAGERIPEQRKNELTQILKDFTNDQTVDENILSSLAEIGTAKDNECYEGPHGERVVQKLIETDTVKEFIKMWREHFLKTMKPKYLPKLWSVDHNLTKF